MSVFHRCCNRSSWKPTASQTFKGWTAPTLRHSWRVLILSCRNHRYISFVALFPSYLDTSFYITVLAIRHFELKHFSICQNLFGFKERFNSYWLCACWAAIWSPEMGSSNAGGCIVLKMWGWSSCEGFDGAWIVAFIAEFIWHSWNSSRRSQWFI